jgi:ABC-2 type transport system ATP-binding protein
VARASGNFITVRTPEAGRLRDLLLGPDVTITSEEPDVLHVQGLTEEQIGTAAWRAQLPVFELTLHQPSLEQAFMQITEGSVEYRSAGATTPGEVAP